jgi:hypothetical protein
MCKRFLGRAIDILTTRLSKPVIRVGKRPRIPEGLTGEGRIRIPEALKKPLGCSGFFNARTNLAATRRINT